MRWLRSTSVWLVAPVAIALLTSMLIRGAGAADVAGSQGVDTALPSTPSQVTIHGRDQFADLAITVNQTANLANQAVSITWTGGRPTISGPGRFGGNYLQIMQCWGDDDGTVPDNPGPPPEQCEQGAVSGTYGGISGGLYPSGFALTRVISRSTWANFDAGTGFLESSTTNVWRPFRAVDGTVVNAHTDPDFNPSVVGGNYWLNPYFNIVTTNEIPAAATGADGVGAELFQVLTGIQSSGLGCGQKVQSAAGGPAIPKCWIVVVPRGTASEENVGTPFEQNPDSYGVATSPVSPGAWRNRVAIPIEFNPVDSPCSLGADERRIAGSELALAAVASWQPLLCTGGALPPFSYAPVSDAAARQQLAVLSAGAPGMVVVSKPLDETQVDPASPVVYAPLTASGIVIGFNIERNPLPTASAAAQQLNGVRIADVNLTPRLVAKLLTQSYRGAVSIGKPSAYDWVQANPQHLGLDPDFLQFNPEFQELQIADSRVFSSLELPAGNSDAAQQLWEWILADPEAKAWLDGQPDDWGMKVNPVYATAAGANVNGLPFGDPAPNSFPKADPFCYQAAPRGPGNSIVPPPICGTDWMPYSRGFGETAQITRAASDGAKVVENPFAIVSTDVWSREAPQYLGRRSMLSVTDSPSARLFGVQMARLSRAGDNGSDRSFVAPDDVSIAKGIDAMTPRSDPTVLEASPSANAPGAYPLSTLTYAAVKPLALDTQGRADYAAFLDYASGPGQVTGDELGQLPPGYVPFPAGLAAQAASASQQILTMVAPPEPPPPTSTTTVVASAPTGTTPRSGTRSSNTTATTTATTTSTESTTTSVPTTGTSVQVTTATTAPPAPVITTPTTEPVGSRYAVPGLGVVALGSALGALEVTKRPRRGTATDSDDPIGEPET